MGRGFAEVSYNDGALQASSLFVRLCDLMHGSGEKPWLKATHKKSLPQSSSLQGSAASGLVWKRQADGRSRGATSGNQDQDRSSPRIVMSHTSVKKVTSART